MLIIRENIIEHFTAHAHTYQSFYMFHSYIIFRDCALVDVYVCMCVCILCIGICSSWTFFSFFFFLSLLSLLSYSFLVNDIFSPWKIRKIVCVWWWWQRQTVNIFDRVFIKIKNKIKIEEISVTTIQVIIVAGIEVFFIKFSFFQSEKYGLIPVLIIVFILFQFCLLFLRIAE